MAYQINGLKDIHKLLMNERKIGGVIEVNILRLRTGEVYQHAVITHIDLLGSSIYSIGFMTEDHQNIIANITELSLLQEPTHKKIYELNNQAHKTTKTKEKIKYLKRLFEINKDSLNSIFVEEARMIIEDIGLPAVKKEINTSIIYSKNKIYSIA
jgi:DNA polymerase III delta prime subunit